nr:hypothetical protein [uncultured Methanocorpusculum sp.]
MVVSKRSRGKKSVCTDEKPKCGVVCGFTGEWSNLSDVDKKELQSLLNALAAEADMMEDCEESGPEDQTPGP